jgi:hypothetical protein
MGGAFYYYDGVVYDYTPGFDNGLPPSGANNEHTTTWNFGASGRGSITLRGTASGEATADGLVCRGHTAMNFQNEYGDDFFAEGGANGVWLAVGGTPGQEVIATATRVFRVDSPTTVDLTATLIGAISFASFQDTLWHYAEYDASFASVRIMKRSGKTWDPIVNEEIAAVNLDLDALAAAGSDASSVLSIPVFPGNGIPGDDDDIRYALVVSLTLKTEVSNMDGDYGTYLLTSPFLLGAEESPISLTAEVTISPPPVPQPVLAPLSILLSD